MDKDQEWAEIKSLRTKIEDAAFEKQTFRFEKKAEDSQLYSKKAVDRAKEAFKDRNSEKAIKERGKIIHRSKSELVYYKEKHSHKEEPPGLVFCSRIRIFDPKTKRFVRSVPFKSSLNKTSHLEVFDLAEKVDAFLSEITEKIWRHKRDATPEAGKRLIEDDKERILKATRRDLEQYGYSEKAIQEAMQILKCDLDKRLEKFKKTQDYEYFVKTKAKKAGSHPWIHRENDLIRDIRSLYKKYTALSERRIDASIAVIFEATDFWPDCNKEERPDQKDRIAVCFERLRKRKEPADVEPPELFDPPQNT